jgi:hypothetical protein
MTPEEAQKLMKGPLGEAMSKFPLRFAKAILFGDRPTRDGRATVRNATASLLNLGHGPLAITCHHVLEEYRARIQQGNDHLFQIGNCRLDPLAQLISDDEATDVAVIRITSAQAREITGDDEIGSSFFEPASWPPTPIREGDYVAFGGFPGEWRAAVGIDAMEFSSYSSGASRVTVARDSYFVSQFEREYWVSSFAHRDASDLQRLGGLSGGPAFALRGLHYDLVGIVYEFSEDYELLYFRHAGVIGADGRLS